MQPFGIGRIILINKLMMFRNSDEESANKGEVRYEAEYLLYQLE